MYKGVSCQTSGERISEFIPQQHQIDAVNYLLSTPYNGGLLYHTLGSGKSCTSIMFADAILEASKTKKVRVLLPAALRKNFIDEYCQVCGKDPKLLRDRFVFYSYNYSKILDLLPLNFDNSVIIVDEAHRIINGKRNGSKIATILYSMMYEAKNSKILLLTGTPLKKIEDLPLYIALLKPSESSREIANRTGYSGDEFKARLITEERIVQGKKVPLLVPRDIKALKKQLAGVVSYYSATDETLDEYPKKIDMPIQNIQMSKYQTNKFFLGVEWELMRYKPHESLKYRNPKMYALLMGLWHVANKNLMTRAASNFGYPDRVQVPVGEEIETFGFHVPYDIAGFDPQEVVELLKTRRKYRSQKESTEGLEIEDVPSLPDATVEKGGWVYHELFEPKKLSGVYSSKMYRVMENIANNIRGKHAIYSVLKTRSGVRLMQALLEMCGIRTLVYSGDIGSDEERAAILNAFNSLENLRGEKYKVILLTEAGGEGITLKAVKWFHILESDKNELKIQQVIGRAIRFRSHENLPKDERFVKVFRYFSVPHKEIVDRVIANVISITTAKKEERDKEEERYMIRGVDRILYDRGQIYYAQIDVFLQTLREVSVT